MGVDPVSIGIMALGTGISAISSLQAGAAKSQASAYQAMVAKKNAELAVQEGDVAAERASMASRFRLGKMKAAQGANGIDPNSGSAVAVRAAQAGSDMTDALTIRSNAARKAYGYETQSELDTQAAQSAKTAGYLGAAGSLLSGASSIYGQWNKQTTVGVGQDLSGQDTFNPEEFGL